MLKSKSEDLAKKLGHNYFNATNGWLSRWKCRFGTKLKKAHGEDSIDAEKWKYTKLLNLLQKYSTVDIYNGDETGLFYRATPGGCLSYKHATLYSSKKAMDNVTLSCSSN
jgi:hypothetical protein